MFAADGSSLGYIQSDILRTFVQSNQIPKTIKQATVAIEDRRFYKHGGIDYQGIVRAAIKDIFGGGKSIQGGSTLTMQLVRNIYLSKAQADTRTIKRKIVEAKFAEELEQRHSKSWILINYLNDVPYGTVGGQTAVGVEAAAQTFFNRHAWQLDLAQSALLAGLPQAPSDYNPFRNPGYATARRHDVLHAMVQSRYITQAQANAADRERLHVQHNTGYTVRREQYFFDYVQQALIDKFGVARVRQGGLKVYTTIDLKKQQEARQAIANNEGQPGDPAASLVTIDPSNGHIVAMASSSSYDKTNFNYAAQAHRQTGSAFKVFVLMAAIHDYNVDPDQTYYDSKELLPGWLAGYPTYHVQTSEHSYQGDDQPDQGDGHLRQHGIRPARRGRWTGQGSRHGLRDGHHLSPRCDPGRRDRRPADRRLAARDGRRLRDARQRRLPHPADRDHQGRSSRTGASSTSGTRLASRSSATARRRRRPMSSSR